MNHKEPIGRKEKARLKREQRVETERAKLIEIIIHENRFPDAERSSLRELGRIFDKSHTWAKDIRDRCLQKKVKRIKGVKFTIYSKRSNYLQLLKREKPGPKPGFHSQRVLSEVEGLVKTKREHPVYGAAKINVMAKTSISAPTAHRILKEHGFMPVTVRKGKVYKSFEMDRVNEMWQIDYVELGTDSETGRRIESLSILDDKSRRILSANADIHATTDDVIELLLEAFQGYGVPERILSDHGTQWAASNGGDTRFDQFCEAWGIEHIMGRVRKPTTQGKVERWHGTLRREVGLPAEAPLAEYRRIMGEFVRFYNDVRPHWALDLRTPSEVFVEGRRALALTVVPYRSASRPEDHRPSAGAIDS